MPDVERLEAEGNDLASPLRLGWTTCIGVVAFYVGCVGAATYPFFLTFRSKLVPSLFDPLQHLWIMRWYKICLLEGRSPILCPEVQYPVGAPLGNYSPLHLQALLYLPLSLVFENDVLCYNLIWLFGMVFTGFGTFLLIWQLVRHRSSACFGGMLAMLSGAMMAHGRAHLELIHLGCFPLFMVAWMRFVDCPSRKRLIAATLLYVLVALCAAYYVVFAIVPAAFYVGWQAVNAFVQRDVHWFRTRAGWLVGFSVLCIPILGLVFGNQIWSLSHGYAASRPKSDFDGFGTALWTYVLPSPTHRLSAILPFDPYAVSHTDSSVGERVSYLGIVTLVLMHYAAVHRARFARAGFWWATFALLVVLSCGAYWQFWSVRISLPADWLKRWVFAFSPIRVPARYNLFAAVAAALLAAAGLRHLLHRLPNRFARVAVYCVLVVLAVADLGSVPYHGMSIPPMPAAYRWIKEHDRNATLLELPQHGSGGAYLYSVTSYWQSQHRITTNGSYSGQANLRLDNLMSWQSPFQAEYMSNPDFLRTSYPATFGVTTNCNFEDYAWLFLNTHKFRYLVLHQWAGSSPDHPVHLDRLKEHLAPLKVFEDADTIVYDGDKLPPPTHPTMLCTQGWRLGWHGKKLRVSERIARIRVYNPDARAPLRLGIEAKAFREARTVRLKAGDRELGRLSINPVGFQIVQTAPFHLPAGLQELTLETDGPEIRPEPDEYPVAWDKTTFSLYVGGICLTPDSPADAAPAPEIATKDRVQR